MKKFFVILGVIFLGLIIIGAVTFGILASKGAALDKESKAYVDAAVPAIFASWSEQELASRASPEFKRVAPSAEIERLFQNLRKLGKMREYKGAKGESSLFQDIATGKQQISARYVANVEFDSGAAEIEIKLIKHGDEWQILAIFVNPAFRPAAPTNATRRALAPRFKTTV